MKKCFVCLSTRVQSATIEMKYASWFLRFKFQNGFNDDWYTSIQLLLLIPQPTAAKCTSFWYETFSCTWFLNNLTEDATTVLKLLAQRRPYLNSNSTITWMHWALSIEEPFTHFTNLVCFFIFAFCLLCFTNSNRFSGLNSVFNIIILCFNVVWKRDDRQHWIIQA